VAMVATLPEYRNRGCAEAVMRYSLAQAREATGLERTVLHASAAGLPLYEEMGYRSVASFLGFALAGPPGAVPAAG
jgi:ribosomal protein S18 acetylase RimI-like enzyme